MALENVLRHEVMNKVCLAASGRANNQAMRGQVFWPDRDKSFTQGLASALPVLLYADPVRWNGPGEMHFSLGFRPHGKRIARWPNPMKAKITII